MRARLRAYQKQALKWMCDREDLRGSDAARGVEGEGEVGSLIDTKTNSNSNTATAFNVNLDSSTKNNTNSSPVLSPGPSSSPKATTNSIAMNVPMNVSMNVDNGIDNVKKCSTDNLMNDSVCIPYSHPSIIKFAIFYFYYIKNEITYFTRLGSRCSIPTLFNNMFYVGCFF